MNEATYFIYYRSATFANVSNALHVWLTQRYPCIYLDESSWFVLTVLDAETLRDELLSLIHADDQLLIFAAGADRSGWNPPAKLVQWMKDNWKPVMPRVR